MHITDRTFRYRVGVVEPYSMVPAAGTTIAVSRRGEGTPVLCLHAIAHGGRDFEAFTERVAGQGFEVVCADWPGQGRSPPDATDTPASAARYAEILTDLIAELFPAGPRPILLGNSIGGAAAIIAAERRPDLVRALVLSNPGGLTPVDGFVRTFCRAQSRTFAAGARGAVWYPAYFSLYYRLVLPRSPAKAQRARIIAACRETAAALSQAWASFAEPEADIREPLFRLRPPVLFAWAKNDQIVSFARSRAAVLKSKATVEMFRGGHSPFLEDPDRFAERFIAFARATLTKPATSLTTGV
jgi:pimeloyl-ACP methyl ester carboxylesterase